MSKTWDIKGLRGVDDDLVTIATVHELEYHGEWMGDEFVAVDIKSAEPVELRFGDYLIYRGDKFVIDYDPSMIKKARSGSYGEAFTYDNVKLFSVARELNNIQFRDVVLNDNGVHTAMSRFPFFAASVEDLADRIQANMNRHSGGSWVVFTPNKSRWLQRKPGYIQESAWNNLYGSSDPTAIVGETDINVDCQDLTCSGALAMVYNTFKVPFVVRGHSVIIGAPAVDAGKIFKYGLGNGLYEIERTANDEQVVTMLYAYGSENNIPLNYYANIKKHMVVTGVRDSHDMGQGFVVYGLRTQVLYSSVKNALTRDDTQCILQYGNVTVKANADASLNGGESYGTQYLYFSFHSDEVDHTDEAFYNALGSGTVTVTIKSGTNINQLPDSMIAIDSEDTYPVALSVNRLMLPGFPDTSLQDWVRAAARGEFIMPGYESMNESMRIAQRIATARVFSNDPLSPWIKSHFAGTFGVKEGSIYFDGSSNQKDIKPTIEGTGADIVTVGSTITDNGYLTEGTDASFEITIASNGVLDWSSAWTSHIEDVYIEMKSGFCTGRKFKLLSEPELTDSGWKMKLEREKDTSMSRYFPYHDNDLSDYAQVVSGDKFVVTGIDLPKGYVDAASVQLLIEACKALDLIDHPNRTYLPKIDEIYMQRQDDEAKASDGEITSLHDTLRAGMTLSMLDTDLDISVESTIDVITIKENGNNGIPTYDVVLRDQKEKGLLNIVDDRIDKAVNGYPLSDMIDYGDLAALFLSKQSDDTAKGLIRFIRGLQVGERFVTGLLGEGGIFRKEADGTTYIEADKLYIRMKAYFDSVEIRDYRHSAGNRIASVAGAKCCRVDWIDASWNSIKQTSENLASTVLFRCYFRGSDGEDEVRNNFIVGDLAYCHITTVETEDDSPIAKGLNMTHYWRLIVGRNPHGTLTDDGEHWIDLSNRVSETVTISGTSYTRKGYQPGSDVPAAQNDIIQLGNIRDTDRQGAIIEFVTGADAPSYQIFQGIGSDVSNPYSLEGKNYVRFGYDSESGGAQAYIGNPDGSSYIWYHLVTDKESTFPQLDIKANVRFLSPTTHQDTTIEDFANAVTGSIGDLQSQIDGEVDTWFYAGTPTLNNAPANEWTTNAEKERHLGDLYYDIGTGDTGGFAYRFIKTESGGTTTYSWQYIDDTAITEALAKASQAYDLADHKRRVFILPVTIGGVTYNNPYPPYDNGDLWVNAVWPASGASKGSTYNDDILRCKTSKNSTQQFSINDWVKASKYTDDSALNDFVTNTYAGDLAGIQTQVDGKAETFYQDTDPSTNWNAEDKPSHVGDIWYDTNANRGKKTYIWRDRGEGQSNRFYWAEQAVPSVVFDEIDGKAAIYVTWGAWIKEGVSNLNEKDLFIPAADTTPTQGGVTYKKDKVYRCTDASIPEFEEIQYTDDSGLQNFINKTYNVKIVDLEKQIDGKAETWYQDTNPASASGWVAADHVGDLWYCTADIAGTDYKKGTTWFYKKTGTNTYAWVKQDVPEEVFDKIDGKSAIFTNTISNPPTGYKKNDLWILPADATINGVSYKQGEVLVSSADSATYNQAHWSRKLRYTDDSALNTFLNGYSGTLTAITEQIDKKSETWYQGTDPSTAWTTVDAKEQHVGDLWYDTTNKIQYIYNDNGQSANPRFSWGETEFDVPQDVYDLIDGKNSIYTVWGAWVVDGVSQLLERDLFIPATNTTQGSVTYKANKVYRCTNTNPVAFQEIKYTDDTAFNNFFANTYQPFVTQIQSQVDGKAETWYQSTNPATAWDTPELKQAHKGDIWHNTSSSTVAGVDAGQDAIWSGTEWIMSDVPQEVYDLVDGKSAIWVTWNGWIDSQGNNNLMLNDLYIPSVDYPTSNPTYKQNKVYRCTTAGNSPVFTEINYTDNAEFNNFVDTTYSADKENLQNQIDGKYETWFYDGVPTLNNAPASSWTSVTLKKNHLGDLYWDKTNKHAYRFVVNNSTYSWQQIGDEGVIAAMAQAADAQDTADNKRRVFTSTPTTPYDVGDLWAQGSGGDIMKCKTARATGSYKASDWELASKYTDDSSLLTFLDGYNGSLGEAIKEQVDKKAETWVSSSNPATAWNTTALKDEHVGDMWLNTSNAAVAGVGSMKTAIYKKNGSSYSWVVDDSIPNSVFDTIDRKKAIYVTWSSIATAMSTNNLQVRDLYIPSSDTTQNGKTYTKNKVYRCTTVGAYSDGAITTYPTFVEIAYTDDSSLNSFLNTVYGTTVLEQIKAQNDKKAETWYQNQDPSTRTPSQNPPGWKGDDDNLHIGDIWHNTSSTTINGVEAGRDAIWTGTGWEMSDVPQSVYDTIDGKADIFVTRPTTYNKNDMWIINLSNSSTYMPDGCVTGDIVIAIGTGMPKKRVSDYQKTDWVKKDRYTDDSEVNAIINKYGNVLGIDDPTATAVGDAVGFLSSVLNHPYGSEPIGGLFLTSLIAMRGTESTPKVWGGMNGVYQTEEEGTSPYRYKGHGIAAWYGGAMKDYERLTTSQKNQGWDSQRWAMSLFRFDGSGYVAGSNLSWDKDGNVTIQGYSINATTLTSNGSAVATEGMLANYLPLGAGSNKQLTGTLYAQNVISKTTGTYNLGTTSFYWKHLFVNRIYLADNVYLEYDSANTAVKLNCSFYATGGVSALGAGSGGSSGGGDVTWALLASSSDTRQIALSHLTGALSTYATRSWVLSQIAGSSTGGTVTAVKVGTTTYNPTNGVVSLPAYPTVPTKVSQLTNDSGFVTSSGVLTTTIYGNYLRVNTNGTNADLTIPYATSASHFLAGQITSDNTSGDANTMQLDGEGTVYSVLTNYSSNSKWQNMPSDFSGFGGLVEIKGLNANLKMQLAWSAAHNNETSPTKGLWFRAMANGGYVSTDWHQVAMTDSNVASATKLQTTRTIWGQSFDGTANISGALTDVGNITSNLSAEWGIYKLNEPIFIIASSGLVISPYDKSEGFVAIRAGDNGVTTGAKEIRLLSNGNVGIGTKSPSYKLHVTGTLGVTGATTLSSTLAVTGASTLTGLLTANGGITIPSGKTLTIGEAVLSWDATNQGIKVTKGLYSQTFISALGAGSGGSSGTGDVTWALLASSSDTRQIALSHLTGALTTYATQSWVNQQIQSAATGGTVTAVKVGETTYSPSSGVVSLPAYFPLTAGSGNVITGYIYWKRSNFDYRLIGYNPDDATRYILRVEYTKNADTGVITSDMTLNNEAHIVNTDQVAGTNGYQRLLLGNSTGAASANSKYGYIRLFGKSASDATTAYFCQLVPDIMTDNRTYTLPNKSGTLALVSELGDYLPTAGGTMTGGITMGISTRTIFNDKGILFGESGTYGRLSARSNGNVALYAGDGGSVYITPNSSSTTDTSGRLIVGASTFTYGGNTIWHAGNDGSDSGLDADLLDGLHASDLCRKFSKTVSANAGVKITFSDECSAIIFGRGTSQTETRIVIIGNAYNTYSQWRCVDKGSNVTWCNVADSRDIELMNNSNGSLYISVLMGRGTVTFTDITGLSGTAVTNVMATTEGNVASATALQTARTIWGQSFDGTANVSGAISGATTIDATGNITIDRNATTATYVAVKNTRSSVCLYVGSTTSLNRGVYDSHTSAWLIYTGSAGNTFLPIGNVGIGTTSPTEKLEVSGNVKATKFIGALEGNADTATTASKLSTVSKKAWGQTYWTSGGIPTTISGNMSSVGNISFSESGKSIGGFLYFDTTNSRIGVGVSSPSYAVHVSGSVYATGAVTCLSDIREKMIVKPTEITVEQIAKMPSIVYRWKNNGDDHDEHVGSIAQDWQKALPQVVLTAKDEKKTLSMQYGVAALVSAITVARKVVDHERRIKELENENKKLKEQLKIA